MTKYQTLLLAIGTVLIAACRAQQWQGDPMEGYYISVSNGILPVNEVWDRDGKRHYPLTNWLCVTSESSPKVITSILKAPRTVTAKPGQIWVGSAASYINTPEVTDWPGETNDFYTMPPRKTTNEWPQLSQSTQLIFVRRIEKADAGRVKGLDLLRTLSGSPVERLCNGGSREDYPALFADEQLHAGKGFNTMTNLLFSIITVLVTNVTESTNERYEQYPGPCPDGRIGCGVMHGWVQGPKIAEATERTLTTTYSRATNAVCADPLIPSMLLGSCELSNRVEVFERQWVPRTNWVADAKPALSGHVGASTNNGSYGIQWNSNLMFRSQSLTVTNLLHVSTNDYSNLNRDYYFPTNKLHVNHPAGGTNTSTSESCALCRELAGNRAKP